ncbi:MAG: hypothetical protein ACRD0W_04935, partial [Acidimicrobiales bacterium]
ARAVRGEREALASGSGGRRRRTGAFEIDDVGRITGVVAPGEVSPVAHDRADDGIRTDRVS